MGGGTEDDCDLQGQGWQGEGMEGWPAGRQSKLLRTEAQWRLEEE